jgi:NAD dependent epimerase/dehydratase family enzyme
MKLIIAGATGTAGRGITQVCLADPRVSKVLILTRRQPSQEVALHDKVEVIIHQDFSTWPTSVLQKLEGAEACLWCVVVHVIHH